MFERETRREKILEARNKELRLKEKTKGILGLGGGLMGGGGGGIQIGGGENSAFGKIVATTTSKDHQEPSKSHPQKEDVAEGGEDSEDPIVKAEREFYEIIKQEQESRLEQRRQKQETDKEAD